MPTRARVLLGVALCSVLPATGAAQGTWVGPQDPCKLSAGHFLVSSSILYLKQAVETRHPDQREQRLGEALRVLTEALTERDQTDNPAAWYFLGRYYVEMQDPSGADTAFARASELKPECTEEATQFRTRLAALPLNEALRIWGEGQPDSAAVLFRLASRLAPDDAEAPLYMGMMYAATGELDSAAKYVEVGVAVAETDTAHGARRKQAQLELARAFETKAYENPVILTVPRVRQQRDSIGEPITRDSSHLATIVGRVNDIRARGRQLDPESRGAFERESTTVADRLTRARAMRDSLIRTASADSVAAAESLAPAIAHYRSYLSTYSDDVEASMALARLYSAAGDAEALAGLIDQVATSPGGDPRALIQGGMTLYNEGYHAPAARLLEAGLAQRPHDRNGLLLLARSYYSLQDRDKLVPVAERLAEVDPLNPNTMRMIALGWALEGNRDSVDHYVAMADSGIGWHVNITQFMSRANVTSMNGSVRNLSQRTLPATTLVFEFLDADGNVVFTSQVDVPALEVRGRAPVSAREQQGGAVAWRYRRQ